MAAGDAPAVAGDAMQASASAQTPAIVRRFRAFASVIIDGEA